MRHDAKMCLLIGDTLEGPKYPKVEVSGKIKNRPTDRKEMRVINLQLI
jgi:hypothetical protein